MSTDPLEAWDFSLPDDRIARRPAEPRDSARLMIVPRDGGPLHHDVVASLPSWLRPGDLLVANDSRVLRARLRARRRTGGAVEALLLAAEPSADGAVPCLLRPARRLATGEVLDVPGGHLVVAALPDADGIARVVTEPSAAALMDAGGELPLPPYLGRPADEADRDRYQTVFATTPGSSAAPTAGLHFTPALIARLGEAGIGFATVTLHVGLGTFRPLRPEDLERGELHAEPWTISADAADAIARTRASGGRVIAVGTTATRVLESAADAGGHVAAGAGITRLFVRPPYRFAVVDGLLTNFHLPRSSLLMLVGALVGRERLLAAYDEAVARGYRFYSYGDAMLLV